MKEETRVNRIRKMKASTNAALDHLRRAISALDDANLYAFEAQEEVIDNAVNKIVQVVGLLKENNIAEETKPVSFETFFSDRK